MGIFIFMLYFFWRNWTQGNGTEVWEVHKNSRTLFLRETRVRPSEPEGLRAWSPKQILPIISLSIAQITLTPHYHCIQQRGPFRKFKYHIIFCVYCEGKIREVV
jgi:hypothetical protein